MNLADSGVDNPVDHRSISLLIIMLKGSRSQREGRHVYDQVIYERIFRFLINMKNGSSANE
jgi:hypothetical protein